ncbi:restriction modification system DNA specificity domain protein [Arcobacter nitrofigilis DSM 7299]|uniref:Restriction modification system DNA specificity domain protein n=1 Tax=Arcobacter nitrofigilis (strain ATCC 33309 / DSM 7299 / CCUG 15893 / LMG 7604 / NCTC 12251 / CI) TaxID=572480 RepID=D5V5W7_ARCNC|nr:restriction endonuclease subunit S [Arcobacter nitrofigilis]ADG93134.1 restriction modification system DNA specificity domain protein [Arcobacter nitrofigilis DSM 7299]
MIEKFIWEVCDVIAGQSPEGKFYNKEEEGIPFYQGKKEFTDKYIGKPTTWTTKVTKEAFKDDILMSVRAPVGPVNFSTEHICIGRGLAAIRVKEEINKEYLFYYLIYHENSIVGNKGAVFNSINKKQIENLKVPLPNKLEEQKQIVEILDKAFESIEQAKANIEKNIQNSKELFQSRLNEIFSQKGDGWEENELGKVCKTGAGGTPLKSRKEYYENGDIPWLCSGEVKQGNIYSSNKYITKKGLDNSSAKLFPKNTVVIAMYGATAGDVGILRFETSTNQAVCGILPNELFIPEFIYYSFSYRKNELIAQATGNAQPNISQIKIKNTLIPIITKKEQIKIVQELDSLKEQTKQLEKHYQQKLDNLEELKKSILQKAFSGELIP